MKTILISCFLLIGTIASTQEVIPLVDFNRYFKSFKNGYFRQIEFQEIKGFKAGDNVVGYIDIRGNLRVYDGVKPMDLSNMVVQYEVSDNLLIWKIGRTLNVWDDGHKLTLTFDCGTFWLKDNMVVFEDIRYNTLNAYSGKEIHILFSSVSDFDPPDAVGENIVAFRDNGNYNKVFWNGKVYELGVWHNPLRYAAGTDILAFNDPMTGTFAVFDKGEFIDVESFHVPSYKAGRGFILYESQNGDLMMYKDGEIEQLTNFSAGYWDVKDDVAVWEENGFAYAISNGEKIELARYKPADFRLKNGVVAFRNIMGGVSALIDGKIYEITNQMNADYEIYGNSVLVKLFNNSYIVFQNGKKYSI